MSGRISTPIWMAAAAALLVFGIGTDLQGTARANDCLAAPNASSPPGQHWYYHIDLSQSQVLVLACSPHASSGEGARIPRSNYRSRHSGIGKSCRQRSALRHTRILSVKPQPTPFVSAKSI